MNKMNVVTDKIREMNGYIKENFLKISVILFAVFLLTSVVSYLYILSLPAEQIQEELNGLYEVFNADEMFEKEGFALFWAIFLNNLRASGISVVSAIIPFLFFPLGSVISNGAVMGVVFGVANRMGVENMFLTSLKFLLPHAIFEIPAFILANAMGLRFCWLIIKWIFGKGEKGALKYHFKNAPDVFMLYIAPALLVAAFIEGVLENLVFGM